MITALTVLLAGNAATLIANGAVLLRLVRSRTAPSAVLTPSPAPIVSVQSAPYVECAKCHATVARYTPTAEGNICANCSYEGYFDAA